MDCLICGEASEKIETGGDYEQLKCPSCGEYKVTRSLLSTRSDMVFHIDSTRDRFAQMRLRGDVPMLSTVDRDLLYIPQ